MRCTLPQLEAAFLEAGIANLPAEVPEHFLAYLDLLMRWNRSMNLTAIREPEEILRRHFVECAFAAQRLPGEITTLLDFGSGAGFPGIPIALCRPEIHVTLAESRGKKAAFLQEAVRVLRLSTTVYGGRVEELPSEERFDAVAMRAVDRMAEASSSAQAHAKKYLALFTTAGRFDRGLFPGFSWQDPIALPASQQSILCIGERQ